MTRQTTTHSNVAAGFLLLLAAAFAFGQEAGRAPVEDPNAKRHPAAAPAETGTNDWTQLRVGEKLAQTGHLMSPAGQTLALGGRVLGLAPVRGGKFLVVKTDQGPAVIETDGFRLLEQYQIPERATQMAKDSHFGWAVHGGSMYGMAVAEDDATVYLTGKARHLFRATVDAQGTLAFRPSIDLMSDKRLPNPLGVALVPGGKLALVALAVANEVAVVDLAAGTVPARIPVGVCPYAVAVTPDGKTAFVSDFGGPPPRDGDHTDTSAGTPVAVDGRGVALRGSVSVIDVAARRVVADIETRIHPEAMALAPDGRSLYVIDASGDGLTVIDVARRAVTGTLSTKPRADLPYGSLSDGLAFSADGQTLFVANAGNNAVALLDPARPAEPPYAFIAAGGFPGAVCVRGDTLFCGNVTGYASDVQKVSVPRDPAALKALTDEACRGFHLAELLRAQARAATGAAPRPVPANPGEPSPIGHVVYIIKENKKFDQVFGDIGRGNVEPKFCEYPRATTPNAHALADAFVLLDNYYCGVVLSCDGHQWATQGLTSPYREKDWSNLHCIYSFGHDPLCFAGCGFIWDHVLRQGLSFRNFGELGDGLAAKGSTWTDNYTAWKKGTWKASPACAVKCEALARYSDLRFPGWSLLIPDQVRADAFVAALKEFAQAGKMPALVTVYLPDDHTRGGAQSHPTPRAYVADNDLALGRVVEALSQSPFWKDMAVFVNEDDPQTGADHVDGHRSLCLLAGPYVKRGGAVVSTFYNQSSVLHTICRILGVPPMNQVVAMAPVMEACFRDAPDFAPYACLPATVPLDELNPPPGKAPSKTQARLAPLTEKLDFSAPDRLDKDALLFSQWAWSTVRGDEPFPAAYAGAHGKGLKALGLRLDPNVRGEDED